MIISLTHEAGTQCRIQGDNLRSNEAIMYHRKVYSL